jgi:hypothetical protein
MATGNYGVVRPADVSTSDIEIFYTFTPNRNTQPGPIQTLDAESLMDRFPGPLNVNGQVDLLPGLYNLNLPANVFTEKGFYNLIIRPREYRVTIQDCGVLSSSPDVKGIVLDTNQLPSNLSLDSSLIGYRIEYYQNDSKMQNLFRIVTSNGTVEAVNLVFCTLTPTSNPITQPNKIPFIGSPGQLITVTNTHFDPIFLEIEMTEHDMETLSYGIYGNQSKSIQDGKYTIYSDNNSIYKQYNLYEIQDDSGNPLYEVREEISDGDIDFTKDFNNITDI